MFHPLIENCFAHAFDYTITASKITIEIKKKENRLVISVVDNGNGFKDSSKINKQSKALQLVEERIKLLDKENSFIIKHLSTGIEVEITLNN